MKLLHSSANMRDRVPNIGMNVGLRLFVKKTITIKSVMHQFSGPCTFFLLVNGRMYEIKHTKMGIVQNSIINQEVSGVVDIVYNQNDLENVNALTRFTKWNSPPCQCDRKAYNDYRAYSQFMEVMGVEGYESHLMLPTNKNYGLNIEFYE